LSVLSQKTVAGEQRIWQATGGPMWTEEKKNPAPPSERGTCAKTKKKRGLNITFKGGETHAKNGPPIQALICGWEKVWGRCECASREKRAFHR